MRFQIQWLDYFFVLRPTLFYPVWTFFLAGFSGGSRFPVGTDHFSHSVSSLWIGLALTFLMGGVYIINQIYDVETDRKNGRLFLIAIGAIPERKAFLQALLLIGTSLGFAFWVDFLLGFGFLTLLFFAGILYNFPPTVWKNHPYGGILVNGIGGMLIYDLGWISGGGDQELSWRILLYGIAGVAVFLYTTLPDLKGDAKTGKITFAVRYGISKTIFYGFLLESGVVVLAFFLREWLLFIPSVLVWPLFLLATLRKQLPDALRAVKYSVFALASAVCVKFPWYTVLIVAIFSITKWYYKKRFRFDYPSLKAT